MRFLRLLPALLLPVPLLCAVPEFYTSELQFLKGVAEGEMDPQLDLHLLQYAPDPRWTLEWMSQRGFRSGLYGAWGSVTSRRLFTDMGIAMNLELGRDFSFRYDRREFATGAFDLRQERLDFWWQARPGVGLAITGWPNPQKELGSAGLGFRLGSPRGKSCLEVHVLDEAFFWNQKTEATLRFEKHPLRLLMDGHASLGSWVMAGSLDLGLRYRMEDSGQSLEGFQRYGTLLGEHRTEKNAWGGSITWATRALDQSLDSSSGFHLERQYLRVSTHGRWETGGPTWYGQLAAVRQRDVFAVPENGPGKYRMDALVLELEAGWKTTDYLELRPGYMASPYRMERRMEGALPAAFLQSEDPSGYTDKVHLRALRNFKPSMSLELLISHTLSGSRFGGASVKGRFLF